MKTTLFPQRTWFRADGGTHGISLGKDMALALGLDPAREEKDRFRVFAGDQLTGWGAVNAKNAGRLTGIGHLFKALGVTPDTRTPLVASVERDEHGYKIVVRHQGQLARPPEPDTPLAAELLGESAGEEPQQEPEDESSTHSAENEDDASGVEHEGEPQQIPQRRVRVQGYEPNPHVRRAIEQWAMKCAAEHYSGLDYQVEDTSAFESYDLRCTRGAEEVRVEVKGTRGSGDFVEVTIGEVHNARGDGWRTDLFVLSLIDVTMADGNPIASGGAPQVVEGWNPAPEALEPIRFRCRVS